MREEAGAGAGRIRDDLTRHRSPRANDIEIDAHSRTDHGLRYLLDRGALRSRPVVV